MNGTFRDFLSPNIVILCNYSKSCDIIILTYIQYTVNHVTCAHTPRLINTTVHQVNKANLVAKLNLQVVHPHDTSVLFHDEHPNTMTSGTTQPEFAHL